MYKQSYPIVKARLILNWQVCVYHLSTVLNIILSLFVGHEEGFELPLEFSGIF